ncbi:mucoidy inhibitor MuiA family protein [Plastoroseomonas arctica]|uniref:Mucoidy inhibitor MuiA family protein n=1 Tax=Plastoroseomonas arctica TaxID=1509237 RepID=A0AAF1KNU1_9PROT|nr:mucoidy inhibitor MuiA family protein [Plastoroseomonas arctica]MBR0656639.1 mucoidy inhibitor MuiA family protein [Plastoroseomonas arctica]
MIRFGTMLVAALLALPVLAQGQEGARIAVAAQVSRVVAYPDQATITRTAEVALPAGESLLVLSGLPTTILRESVTARGRALGAVTIGAVDLREAPVGAVSSSPRLAEIERERRDIATRIEALDVEIRAWTAQAQMSERLVAGVGQRPAGTARGLADEPGAWREAMLAVRNATAEAGEAIRVAQASRRGMSEQLQKLTEEAAPLGRPGRPALEVVVAVQAAQATRLELDVTYQIPGVTWRPVYEARLDTREGKVTLRQEAILRQTTGEDWRGVALVLSTTRPSGRTQPPALEPWRIAFAPPPMPMQPPASAAAPVLGGSVRGRGIDSLADEAEAPRRQDAAVATSEVVVQGLSVEYAITGESFIAGDGSERRVRIGEAVRDATLSARVVPAVDPRAYLQARFTHAGPAPLLPGNVALYLDGVFVGRTTIPLIAAEQPLPLGFGADDRVVVSHLPQLQANARGGWVMSGRRTVMTRTALTTVRSAHARPIEITVLDRVPVSGDAELTVEMIAEPAPTARDVEDRPGVVAWTWTARPNEERRIRFGHAVSAPQGRPVQGLPR